jgi:hypothetical protein
VLYPQNRGAVSAIQPQTRASHGLEQFFSSIQDEQNLSILDFAGASQANISFITTLGHRIYSNDIVRTLEETFGGDGEFVANQADPLPSVNNRSLEKLFQKFNSVKNSF